MYLWMLTFFGLRPNHRPLIHSEIFDLIYHSNGGFTFSDVYELPIYLRKFYMKKLKDVINKQNSAAGHDANKTQQLVKK